ncbi:DNA gyrase/topoisomerase IV subunit A [Romboutsia ilealis]|uniref:DNA gyrase/topoisomerase IV subunit A n=1 Tax=Romboutsia ilealis TaxID=1115758 RepID=UPI00272D2CEB|nr:DNA topoisomerase (ATP-hydrolyzing) subunit A [Romboutsia ilealis]
MSKNGKKKDLIKRDYKSIREKFSENIEHQNIGDACTAYMKIFGTNKNVMRHMPLEIDGLLPGERRLLFTMWHDKKLRPEGKYLKLTSSLGSAMEYHPHGDGNLYNTAVKLAQYWNNTLCLVDGYGNYGGEDGSCASAHRYLEAKLTMYAYKCFFEEFTNDIVDMKERYTGGGQEPEYLPAKYPNIFFKPSYGIGYGLFASIPTYNFNEICEFAINLIDDPEYDTVIYPDIPSGCDVIDDGQFLEIAKTGVGSFRMKCKTEVIPEENKIIIRTTPLQVGMNSIVEKIYAAAKDGSLKGLDDIENHNGHTSVRQDLIFKPGADLDHALNVLYKKCGLISTYPIIFNVIDDIEVREYTMKTLLQAWISARRDIKRKVINKGIVRKNERLHVLSTLLFILSGENGEKTLKIVKKAENTSEIVEKLMKNYRISSLQAKSIASMSITAFSKESVRRYKEEHAKLSKEVEKLMKISKSPKKIDKLIKEELLEGMKLFGTERKSEIVTFDGKKVVRDTDHIIVFTKNGLVKKLNDNVESIGFIEQGDYPTDIININNKDSILIFDQTGKVSSIAVDDIISTELSSPGLPITDLVPINGKLVTVVPKPTDEELVKIGVDKVHFVMVTKGGTIKKTLASNYTNVRKDLKAINIADGDELVSVKVLYGNKDIVIYSDLGFGVRVNSDDIREVGRTAQGVKGMDLTDKDFISGMNIIGDKDKYIFVLTNKGKAKKCPLDTFATMKRTDKPLRVTSLDARDEISTIVPVRGNEVFKVYMKTDMKEIAISEIDEMTRLAKPKKLLPVKMGDCIIDVKMIGRLK